MGVIGDLTDIAAVFQKADNIELYEKVLRLQGVVSAEREEQERLRERITELEQVVDLRERLFFDDNRYWLNSADGSDRDGPFCSRCWDSEQKLIRLHCTRKAGDVFDCPACHTGIIDHASLGL